ncbi:MAG TPA: MlaD family protein [Actinomycetota bacterium]|jgi:phospholipid/cholesterol/gamma-HCH transport system substrate-binding protein
MTSLRFSKKTLGKVIAFTILSMVFTVALGMKIGNLHPFSHSYRLEAVFSDASGVFKGDAVKLAGVDVGRVVGAKIENGHALVTFTVNNRVKLPRDSVVALRWRNVLGQRFLYLYPGRDRGGQLRDGDRVPLSNTENAGDLGEFLNHLGPILRAIDPEKANAFLDAMNTALVGNEAAVRQLLDNGGSLASRLGEMDREIRTLIGSSDTVMSTYAKQNHDIELIIDDLNVLGARLQNMTGDLNSFVVNFARVQEQLDKLLRENRGHIDASLANLESVSEVLARNKGRLAQTLCTLPAGVSGYWQTTSWGEWFNVRIVKVVLKDQHGNVVGGAQEDPGNRVPAPPPYQCQNFKGRGPAGSKGSDADAAAAAADSDAQGFGSLLGFLGFVLEGTSHG